MTRGDSLKSDSDTSAEPSAPGSFIADESGPEIDERAGATFSDLAQASEATASGPARHGDGDTDILVNVINLAAGDDMAMVLARLRAMTPGQAAVVVPGESRLFKKEAEVALLHRFATDRGLSLALVTRDPNVRGLARRHSVPASASLARAQAKARALTGSGHPAPAGRVHVPALGQLLRDRRHNLTAVKGNERLRKASGGSRRGWEDWLLLLVLILGAGLAWAGAMLLVWPQATVTVIPAGEPLERQIQVTADTVIELADEGEAQIPARPVRTEIKGQAQVSTLARQDAPDAKAQTALMNLGKLLAEAMG